MNGDPEQANEEERSDGDGVEQEQGAAGDAGEGSSELSKPYGLSDAGLGTQWWAVADDEVKETFGADAYKDLESGRVRWAARFSGEGLDGPSADPVKTATLLRRVAITARWIGNGLFPGHGAVPGFVLGEAAHSIVLEFTLAPEEEPVVIPEQTEGDEEPVDQEREHRTVYPSVEGGRYFAALLDHAEKPARFVERLQPIGRQAVLTYQGALQEFVEFGAEVDVVVPAIGVEGEPVRRHVNFPPNRSEKELVVLNRPPEEESSDFQVEGLLYAQNSLNLGFGIQRDNGAHVTGEYDLRVADKLGPAWNKRVWANIEEIGPKAEWMPRAGRTRRVLMDVAVLAEGETRLTN